MSWLDRIAARAGVERDWNQDTGTSASVPTSNDTDTSFDYHKIPYLGQFVGHTANNATMGVANLAQFLGAEEFGNYLYQKGLEGEARLPEMLKPELSLSYITNPNGLLSTTAQVLGSVLSMAPVAALAPVGGIGAGAAAAVSRIPQVGLFASRFVPGAVRWATTGPVEAMMEGGGVEREMLAGGASREAANEAAWKVFRENAGLLTVTNAIGGGLLYGRGIKMPKFSNPVAKAVGAAVSYAPQTAAEMVTQGYEEGVQEGIQAAAMGRGEDSLAQKLNPFQWTEGQWDAAKVGFAGAGPLVGGAALLRRLGRQSGNAEGGGVDAETSGNEDGSTPSTPTITPYDMPVQSDAIAEQVGLLKPAWQEQLPMIGGILKNKFGLDAVISSGARSYEHQMEVNPDAPNSYHVDHGEGGDAVDIVLPDGTTQEQAEAVRQYFENTGVFSEVLFHDVGSGYHLHLGGLNGALSSSAGTEQTNRADHHVEVPQPDFTGLIADENNIQATQEAVQKLIDTDSLTPEQHMAIIRAAEMARDTPVGNGTDAALEAETVNEWQQLIDRKDVKGIFEKDPQRVTQTIHQLGKEQRAQRTRAAIENQQQIEAEKQALQAAQAQQNVQGMPAQVGGTVQQVVPEQGVAQMGAAAQPENVMQNAQVNQDAAVQMMPPSPPVHGTFSDPVQDVNTAAPQMAAPQMAAPQMNAAPAPSEEIPTGAQQEAERTVEDAPQPRPRVSQEELSDILSKVQEWEKPLLSIPEYVAARNRQDWDAASRIAYAAGIPGLVQFYDTLMEHGRRNATNITPTAPRQEAQQKPAERTEAPAPVVGVRPNVPAMLPEDLEERRKLSRALGRFMQANGIPVSPQLRDELSIGRGRAIHHADKKIAAWEAARAEQEAGAAEETGRNTPETAQDGAQAAPGMAQEGMSAQHGKRAQKGAEAVRGKSAQNQSNKNEGASVSTEPESLNEPSESPSIHAPSSTSTIASEEEESNKNSLNEDEREAVKGLSADAKQVYQLVRDKLSGMKNKAVQRASSVGAVLLARHADIIARKVRAVLGRPFTAMDYYRTWVDLQYGGGKDADGNVYAQRRAEMSDAERKEMQFRIIEETNPMHDDIHTGIRSVDDILTAKEAFETKVDEDSYAYPDFTEADGKAALKNGEVTIYSSYPIAPGMFVTPSKMQAQDYAGGGKVYSKKVSVKDVAWIHSDEGQYAPIETESFNQSAWHGSPHDFDGFDLGAIGTGEGAQVHGYGLYFAQDRKVSEGYRERLTYNNTSGITYNGIPMESLSSPLYDAVIALGIIENRSEAELNIQREEAVARIQRDLNATKKEAEEYQPALRLIDSNVGATVEAVEKILPNGYDKQRLQSEISSGHGGEPISEYLIDQIYHTNEFFVSRIKHLEGQLTELKKLDISKVKMEKPKHGSLFEVEIPDDDVLLDEQKPFDEQPKLVQEKLEELFEKNDTIDLLDDVLQLPIKNPELRQTLGFMRLARKNIRASKTAIDVLRDVLDKSASRSDRINAYRALLDEDIVDFDEMTDSYEDDIDNVEASRDYLEDVLSSYENGLKRQQGSYQKWLDSLPGDVNLARMVLSKTRSGREIYNRLSSALYGDKAASLALNEVGIKGITYVGGRDGRCYVIFDDKAISIIEKFNQQMNAIVKGTTQDMKDGQRIISLLTEADESTFLHEMGHLFLLDLERLADMSPTSAEELQTVRKWAAWSEGQAEEYKDTPFAAEFAYIDARIRAAIKRGDEKKAEKLKRQWEHERFARGFEMYLKYGEAPTKGLRAVFAKFRAFLQRVYQAFTGTGGRATAEVEAVMARMISIEDKSDLTSYPRGKETKVYTDSGKALPVQYRVVSVDDLIASHAADDLSINPGYPSALQPRDRERVMMRQQVDRMASTLRPEDLGEGRNLNQGAPIIRSDGVVLNGNGRVIAIQRSQNRERGTAYRSYLIEHAEAFGLNKADVAGVENPVLVREVQGDISADMMQDIIGSTTGGLRMGASENAQHDAGKITYGMMDTYVPNDKGDLTSAANRNFVAGILHKITGSSERNAYLDKDGHVNADGIQRVKRALFALAYGDDELVAKMSESTDDDIRNVSNGLMTAAPMMARLPVKKGALYVKELQDAIGDAVKQLDILRASGESVKDYLGAQSMFAEYEDSNEMRLVLEFLDTNKRSGKRIATFFSRVAQTLDGMETKSTNDLFEAEQPSLMEVLEGAKNLVESGGQDSLFGEYIAKEADALYEKAARKFPGITDKEVADHVREAIQLTLDFGHGKGEIKGVAGTTFGKEKLPSERGSVSTDDYRSSDTIRDKKTEKELKRGKIYGLGITRKLVNDGAVSLVGQKAESAADLAEIAQVLRHHGYEKFHYVYTDDAGNVKFHETVTARLPANAPIFMPNDVYSGRNSREYLENAQKRIAANMNRFGATKFYFIHNHPSGDPTPSREDFDVTKALIGGEDTAIANAFGGHVILDHNIYEVIGKTGVSTRGTLKNSYQADYSVPEKPHAVLGTVVTGEDVTQRIADLYGTESETTAFYLTTKGVVRSVQKIHDNFKNVDGATQMNYLRYCARSVGGFRVILATSDKKLYDSIKERINSGRDEGILDVVLMENGRAFHPEEKIRSNRATAWFGQQRTSVRAEQVLERKRRYGSNPIAGTVSELLQHDPSLKKSALEYGAREKDGKVVFVDKAQEKDFLRVANALINDVLAKFSIAWHGSPFYFDSFSLGAINSGEGAQAHGYGLYFARNRETAESYRGDLSGNEDIIHYYGESYENTSDGWMITDGNEAGNTIESDDPLAKAFDAMASNHGDVAEAIKDLESELDDRKEELGEDEDFESDEEYNQLRDAIDILKDDSDDIVVGDPGRLFKVEIPDEDVMLDEDFSYDEQPTKVKSALKKLVEHVDSDAWEDYHREKIRGILEADSGKYIYDEICDIVGTPERASKLLNKFGVEGISYDGQRDGRCYVVFDDKAIDVLETFSARRQEGIQKMLKEISLVSPKQLTSRQKAIFGWGKEMGVPVVFFKGNPSLHGFHSNGVTFLNVDGEITPQWTFWHEAMHWMKANNPDIYNDLVRAVSGAEGFTKKQLDAYRREIGAPRMSDADVIEEMLADVLPDVKRRVPLLRDVGKRDKNVVQRLVAWIHDVMRRFHDYFRTPHAGLTPDQRMAMVKAFGNLVGTLRDTDGKLIFRVQNEGVRITLRNGKPLPAVKFSLDNTGKVGDNEGGRNLGEARKEAICSNVLARMKTRVHEMLKQGVPFAEIQKELEDENSTSREEALRVFKTQWNIFNSPRVNKRNIVERITKREDFTDDEVNELFEQYKATMKEMLDYGGFIYKEAAFQQRGNREFLAGVHSWRDLERANARHGGSAHTGHKNSLNTKHLESQGAFSMPASKESMRWIAAHPFKYDESRTMDENIQRAESLAQEYLDTFGTTDKINTPARQKLRREIADKLYGKGAKKKEGRAWLVLGLPASGKSTIADPLVEREGALLIDSDEAKKLLPEFSNGLLAGAVHEESANIADEVMIEALSKGDNVVLPIVGKTLSSLNEKRKKLEDAGYEVNLVYVDLPIEKAIERTKTRFRHTGRLVSPRYLQSVGLKPRQNYDKIKAEKGVGSYEAWDNDILRGETPRLIERSARPEQKAPRRWMGGRGQHARSLDESDGLGYRNATGTGSNSLKDNNENRSDNRGGFSMPKFSANTQEDRKGNFKWLTGAIRSFVGVAPADNLELPGRVQRTVTLSPKDLEKRIRERWIQEKNIISKEEQKDGTVKVTYYPDTHDVGYADWVKSVRQVAKRNPFVKVLYDLAHKAMRKQEHLRNEFGKTLKEFSKLVKNKEDLKSIAAILWQGDAEGKAFTDAELRAMGASENVIKAYKLVRRELDRAYKMLNDARMQVRTRSQTIAADSLETFKKNHWIKDEDVISVTQRSGGKVLLTWRGGKTYETEEKIISAEALELMKQDDDIIITRSVALSPTQYGEGMYEVDYVERIKPIHKLTGYMPHFFHEWMVYEKYKDPQTGEERYTSVGSGRTMNEAVRIGNEIAEKNKDKQYVLRPKGFDLGVENSVVIGDVDFEQMSKRLAENTEMTLADARTFLQEDVGVSLKSRHRFFGNMMKRKGAEGFDQDVPWVLAHYFNGAARYIAMEEFKPAAISMYERFFGAFGELPKNLTAKFCQDLINDVNGNPRGVETWLNDLIKKTWVGKHIADSYGDRSILAMNAELSTWNAITKLGLLNFASAAVNFSQFINVGTALNDYGYAMKGLKRALNPSAMDEKIIEASGLLDDINAAADNGGYTQRRGGRVRGIYSGIKHLGELSLILFQKADTLMRKAAVLGAYYQGVEQKGMKKAPGDELSAEAIAYAQEINDDANFDYSAANAPNLFRMGSVVTQQMSQFQKYPIMQFEFIWNILTKGTRGQKVRFFVPYVLFCGIPASIPFGGLLNQIFSDLFGFAAGDDDKDFAQEVKAEVLRWAGKDPVKKAIAETALYGILAPTFGLDISGRIGMSNAFGGEFYGAQKPESVSDMAIQQLGGPALSSVVNFRAQLKQGNPIEALKAVSPALGNMAQAWVGESRTTQHRVNARYDTAYDKLVHALGFRSVEESKNSFIMNYEYEQKSKLNRMKQEAIQEYINDPSDENRRLINALGITERQIKEARIQQERTALERATEGRPKTSGKHGASRKRKEEDKKETLYDTLDDE